MKSLKPFVLGIVGAFIVILLVAFTKEESKKEYLMAIPLNNEWQIIRPDLTEEKMTTFDKYTSSKDEVKMLNNLAKEGWELKQIESRKFYFERIKQ